ncbi:uncharacterized protein PpBr36_10531 [Pyricularia pennisetigena]|uniref:uncharacterized protein n=1 Tax=Pyricularia pennisetigena TaxID=1578925 RepID=UPI001151FBC6|nr:uncharacterized protein PpBr36_10531 [Pyricularia pennisetigena]TLS21270.1 hypothetical protein PpBr36_10531 [Pyricularia pennisetigena]
MLNAVAQDFREHPDSVELPWGENQDAHAGARRDLLFSSFYTTSWTTRLWSTKYKQNDAGNHDGKADNTHFSCLVIYLDKRFLMSSALVPERGRFSATPAQQKLRRLTSEDTAETTEMVK